MPILAKYAFTEDVRSYTDNAGNTVWDIPLRMVHTDYRGVSHKFLQFRNGTGNLTAVVGAPVGYESSYDWVTNDLSDTSAGRVVGILPAVITDLRGTWVQVAGTTQYAITTDTNIVAGSLFVWSADSTIAPFTDPGNEETIFGAAIAADAGSSLAAGNATLLKRVS